MLVLGLRLLGSAPFVLSDPGLFALSGAGLSIYVSAVSSFLTCSLVLMLSFSVDSGGDGRTKGLSAVLLAVAWSSSRGRDGSGVRLFLGASVQYGCAPYVCERSPLSVKLLAEAVLWLSLLSRGGLHVLALLPVDFLYWIMSA